MSEFIESASFYISHDSSYYAQHGGSMQELIQMQTNTQTQNKHTILGTEPDGEDGVRDGPFQNTSSMLADMW